MPRDFLKRRETQVSGFAKLRRLNERSMFIFVDLEKLDVSEIL